MLPLPTDARYSLFPILLSEKAKINLCTATFVANIGGFKFYFLHDFGDALPSAVLVNKRLCISYTEVI